MFNIGDIVRYAPAWCTPEERKYLHVIKERCLNPVTHEETRYLISTINTKLSLGSTSVVDECMIEATGFNAKEFQVRV